MSLATLSFLLLRVVHVLLAAVWVGATVLMTLIVMPSLAETGPAAGPMIAALTRRRIHVVMATLGGTTVLTGLYLYWRFTGGFDPALSGTRAAMIFGTGGVSGILALIVGGAVIARNIKKMEALGATLVAGPQGGQTAILTQIDAARRRATAGGRIVIALQVVALSLMAIGHYV